jgi:hypothetical protein
MDFAFDSVFFKNIEWLKNGFNWILSVQIPEECFLVLLPIVSAVICIVVLVVCGQTSGGEFRADLNGKSGGFIDRSS